jgi:hypothetical protein
VVRLASQGKAWQEVVVRKPARSSYVVALPDGTRETKRLVAGVPARSMQPARGKSLAHALLWPAEDGFGASSPFVSISARPPDSRLGWLPGGPSGVVLVFLLASLWAACWRSSRSRCRSDVLRAHRARLALRPRGARRAESQGARRRAVRTHCVHVALVLARLGYDDAVIAAGILHDVVEDCEGWTLERIEREFGAEVRATWPS